MKEEVQIRREQGVEDLVQIENVIKVETNSNLLNELKKHFGENNVPVC